MSTKVLTLTPVEIDQLRQTYTSQIVAIPPHSHFQLKVSSLSVTAYLSGKVVFQGDTAAIDSFLTKNGLQETSPKSMKKTSVEEKNSPLPDGFANWSVIGSDEVGNGSYFGPLTAAAVYVPKEKIQQLKALGVKDSKSMTDEQIRALVPKIKELVPYKLLVVSPQKYNEIHETQNLNKMKAKLHNQAQILVLDQIDPVLPEGLLIDEFCAPNLYYKYLKGFVTPSKQLTYFATKGESHHIAVAAASMIARDGFLAGLEELSRISGYDIPSGAGDKEDALAAKILKLEGEEALYKLVKWHFANTEKAKKIARQSY